VPDNRRIPSHIWAALAKLKFEAEALCPYVVWSIIKAEAKCHDDHVHNGVTNFIRTSDIASLIDPKTNKNSMIKVNGMMEAYHEVADMCDLDRIDRATIVDKADILMIRLMFDKDVPDNVTKPEQIAGETIQAIINKFPEQLALLKNQWAEFIGGGIQSDNKSASEQKSVVATGLIEYGSGGSATNAYRMTCAKMGFSVGLSVFMPKQPGRLFKIIDLDETQVRLRELDPTNGSFKGKQLSVIEYPHFLDRYSIKKEVELLKGWPANNIV